MVQKKPELFALLYVSCSQLGAGERRSAIDNIVRVSQARNRQLRVTGALLATERHFAQIIEGPRASIDVLMTSINADPRHRDIIVVASGPCADRQFSEWALAYAGASIFIDRKLGAAFRTDRHQSTGRTVIALMQALLKHRRPSLHGAPAFPPWED